MCLVAWLGCAGDIGAQEATRRAQPAELVGRSRRWPAAFPWDDIVIEWNEPRYKVEAIRFKARDESGFDWLGSDEVIVETVDAEGWTVSEEIGSVNSGDTHDFNPGRSCIVPVRPGVVVLGNSSNCIRSGQAAPLSFVVRLWEQDFFLESFCAPHDAQFHSGPHCPNPEPGADFIGVALIDLVATGPRSSAAQCRRGIHRDRRAGSLPGRRLCRCS